MPPSIVVPKIQAVTVRSDGDRVQLIRDGRVILDVPWQVADQLSDAFRVKAREAEEIAKATQVIHDGAILLRSGAPFGLSNHPKIREETAKEAAWNADLRRYMPGGVKSAEQFGTPSITSHPRKDEK